VLKGQKAKLGGKTPYQEWVDSQGIPVLKEFYVKDLGAVELEPWDWKGGLGAYLNLIGTGESNDSYICEIPPGKNLKAQRYLFEEMIYVVSGRGATSVWNEEGRKSTFEWGPGSVFSPPINTWRQHFNGSGSEPARFFAVTSAPLVINLFHNSEFVFNNSFPFEDRFDNAEDYFSGKGESYDFKAIKVEKTAPPLQPAALVAGKADFITMFRASNDEVAQRAADKQNVKLKRIYMKDNGLNIYGSSLIVKDDDVKNRPNLIRAYVEGTMEGLRYARDHQEEALEILMKYKPELNKELARVQLKNAVEQVLIPPESLESGFGYMEPEVMEKTVEITNEYFDMGRKVTPDEVYTNLFVEKKM